MTDRERFEEWVSGTGQPLGLNFRFGSYFEADTSAAWRAWQASRKQALAQSLSAIDKESSAQPTTYDFQRAARDGMKDAAAIVWRLANPEGEQG